MATVRGAVRSSIGQSLGLAPKAHRLRSLFLCPGFCTVYIRCSWPDTMCEVFQKHDQFSHLGKTIDALILVITFDTLLIKFMQTAQLTFNGQIVTEFFAVLFLFQCREKDRNPPKYPRFIICWDLFLCTKNIRDQLFVCIFFFSFF